MKGFAAADPYVLRVQDRYYLYCTPACDGVFTVRESSDMLHWSAEKIIFRADESFWGKDCFWAPQCHVINGRYCLFFSANRKDSDKLESFAITAVFCDTPDGCFIDELKRPLFTMPYPTIDANILVDEDHIYLYYSRCCFEHEIDGVEESWIYGAELKPDLSGLLTQPVLLLRPEQAWEGKSVPTTHRRWNEGSFIIHDGSSYHMIYSANCYLEPHYAMGCAVGTNPLGPFAKRKDNPVYSSNDVFSGTGHGCIVQTDRGLAAVFHGRTTDTGETRIALMAPAGIVQGRLVIHQGQTSILLSD